MEEQANAETVTGTTTAEMIAARVLVVGYNKAATICEHCPPSPPHPPLSTRPFAIPMRDIRHENRLCMPAGSSNPLMQTTAIATIASLHI